MVAETVAYTSKLKDAELKTKQAMKGVEKSFKGVEKPSAKAAKKVGWMSAKLKEMATTAQLVDGPLGGVASRLTVLSNITGTAIGVTVGLSLAVAGFYKVLKTGLQQQDKTLMFMQQYQAQLKATGNAAGTTSLEMDAFARSLAYDTLTSVDDARKAISLLTTTTKLTAYQIKRVATAAQNMAAIFGTSASSEAKKLGRALSDPAEAATLLKRYMIELTDEQQRNIKTATEQGDIYAAQKIILDEVAKSTKGVAKAQAATTLAGSFDTLGQSWDRFSESFSNTWVFDRVKNSIDGLNYVLVDLANWMDDDYEINIAAGKGLDELLSGDNGAFKDGIAGNLEAFDEFVVGFKAGAKDIQALADTVAGMGDSSFFGGSTKRRKQLAELLNIDQRHLEAKSAYYDRIDKAAEKAIAAVQIQAIQEKTLAARRIGALKNESDKAERILGIAKTKQLKLDKDAAKAKGIQDRKNAAAELARLKALAKERERLALAAAKATRNQSVRSSGSDTEEGREEGRAAGKAFDITALESKYTKSLQKTDDYQILLAEINATWMSKAANEEYNALEASYKLNKEATDKKRELANADYAYRISLGGTEAERIEMENAQAYAMLVNQYRDKLDQLTLFEEQKAAIVAAYDTDGDGSLDALELEKIATQDTAKLAMLDASLAERAKIEAFYAAKTKTLDAKIVAAKQQNDMDILENSLSALGAQVDANSTAGKAMAITSALIGAAKAAEIGFPQNIPMIIQTAAQFSGIIGQFHGGTDAVPDSMDNKSFLLKAGERVVQPAANKKLTAFLDNPSSTGGTTITQNIHIAGNVTDQKWFQQELYKNRQALASSVSKAQSERPNARGR
jgi:hypothetical protein